MEFDIFSKYRDLTISVLKKGDVGWVVGIQRGSCVFIEDTKYFVEGRISATHEKKGKAQSLVCYELTSLNTKKQLNGVFLSDELIFIENKIKRWYFSEPLPTNSSTTSNTTHFVFDEETEQERPAKKPKKFIEAPTCGYNEEGEDDDESDVYLHAKQAREVKHINEREEAKQIKRMYTTPKKPISMASFDDESDD